MSFHSKYELVPLGEVARFINGDRSTNYPKGDDYVDNGTPFISATELREGRIDYSGVRRISRSAFERLRSGKIQRDDVLFCLRGSIGKIAYVKDGEAGAIASSLVIVRATERIDSRYLFFGLSSQAGQQAALGLNNGAAQPNLSVGELQKIPLPLPPLPMQRRIAAILSAYDELIENSQRRINILESMARALYREWFVHFRFPGHESVPRVPSPLGEIPQGWEVKEMQEVAEVIDCLHSKKPSACADGAGVLLQLNNIGEGGKLDMRDLFRINTDDYRHWTSRIELCPGDCVITNVGRVGAVAQIPEGAKAAPGRNMTAIRVRPGKLTPTFLIEYLLSSHMASEVAKKKDLGTIMDSLNVKGIIRLHVPCPPSTAMGHFEAVARPIRKRIELLVEQIDNLSRTRDMTLPRLLSGHIDMETIAA